MKKNPERRGSTNGGVYHSNDLVETGYCDDSSGHMQINKMEIPERRVVEAVIQMIW